VTQETTEHPTEDGSGKRSAPALAYVATHRRQLIAVAASLVVIVPLAWMWQASRLPGSYSILDMGYVDTGGGPNTMAVADEGHAGHGTSVSVADLVADPDRPADVSVELTARQERVTLASGRVVDGYSFNGTSPGPLIEATEGDLVEVRVHNDNVADGITVHWHGVDVPNAEDGVAGVTQDAIHEGEDHVYRFVVDDPGSYWYHSHQVSHTQVLRGLFGPLVVHPEQADDDAVDIVAVTHTYGGTRTVNGEEGTTTADVPSGQLARVRVVNTDNGAVQVWTSGSYRVLAVDGRDVNGPTEVTGQRVSVPAGGRYDLEVTAPARVQVGSTALVLGDDPGQQPQPQQALDMLAYGAPAALPFDPTHADRTFRYSIGRRPGFLDGKPGFWWSVNGHLWPDVPMYVVDEGDVVVMEIENHSGEVHPMHLHGHHAVVLSRDGEPATGSPWWVDSLDVDNNQTMVIAFMADNPGVWMDHCHNLKHAAQGLVAHLMYSGVTVPYLLGDDSGNKAE
jgi:FtsP/CotA-like multicopper oxidase with cupredoxin domain